MLYWLLFEKLSPHFGPARLFGYVTFRTAFASLSALFISIWLGPWLIRKLREFQIGQHIREAAWRHGEEAARELSVLQGLPLCTQPRTAQAAGAPVDGHQRAVGGLGRAHDGNRARTAAGVGSGATAPRPCTDKAAAALA